jgi:hypothetical protein
MQQLQDVSSTVVQIFRRDRFPGVGRGDEDWEVVVMDRVLLWKVQCGGPSALCGVINAVTEFTVSRRGRSDAAGGTSVL